MLELHFRKAQVDNERRGAMCDAGLPCAAPFKLAARVALSNSFEHFIDDFRCFTLLDDLLNYQILSKQFK